MRVTIAELRELVLELLTENRLPDVWYHGSPWGNMGNMGAFRGSVIFLSDSDHVAGQYKKPLIGTGARPGDDVAEGPGVYTVRLKFGDDQVFDTRRPEHMELFMQLVREARAADPEDPVLRKSDITHVHPAHGSRLGGAFPSYGCVRFLLKMLEPHGFRAAIIAEGAQGASLAVSNPGANLEIVSHS